MDPSNTQSEIVNFLVPLAINGGIGLLILLVFTAVWKKWPSVFAPRTLPNLPYIFSVHSLGSETFQMVDGDSKPSKSIFLDSFCFENARTDNACLVWARCCHGTCSHVSSMTHEQMLRFLALCIKLFTFSLLICLAVILPVHIVCLFVWS